MFRLITSLVLWSMLIWKGTTVRGLGILKKTLVFNALWKESLLIPLSQLRLEYSVWRSFWPWRTSWTKTWSSCSPHTPAKTRCFHHWTQTSRRPGISSYRLSILDKQGSVSSSISVGGECWLKYIIYLLTFGWQKSLKGLWPLGHLLKTKPAGEGVTHMSTKHVNGFYV